jgi:hypothetical protein
MVSCAVLSSLAYVSDVEGYIPCSPGHEVFSCNVALIPVYDIIELLFDIMLAAIKGCI